MNFKVKTDHMCSLFWCGVRCQRNAHGCPECLVDNVRTDIIDELAPLFA